MKRKKEWTDFSLPGYKYLGPGNRLDKGKPTNRNDAVAQEHDYAYESYLKKRQNPYTAWNRADDEFLKKVKLEDYGGVLGNAYFQTKKFAFRAGIINDIKEEPSVVNSPRDADMSKSLRGSGPSSDGDSAGGSGNTLGLKETPVDYPFDVTRGPPDETFVSLPHVETGIFRYNDTYAADHAFRMNSPYDPHVQNDNVSPATIPNMTVNSPAGDPDGTSVPARWYNLYAGLYAYYHTIACRYNVYVENMGSEPLWAHCMFYNETLPPPEATNQDIICWPQVRSRFLTSPFSFYSNNSSLAGMKYTEGQAETAVDDGDNVMDEADPTTAGLSNLADLRGVTSRGGNISCVFSGVYRPGDFKREVLLDSQVENWTATNTNPSLPERLLVRLKPDNPGIPADAAGAAGDDIKYKITVKLDYLVEFKELSTYVRWPVVRQPITYSIIGSSASAARSSTG